MYVYYVVCRQHIYVTQQLRIPLSIVLFTYSKHSLFTCVTVSFFYRLHSAAQPLTTQTV